MECPHCKGLMKQATAPFRADRRGYHVVWDALPAWLCTQCGEPLFEAKEVDAIQKTLELIDRETASSQRVAASG